MAYTSRIRDGMPVLSSDGETVGRIEGSAQGGFMLRPEGAQGGPARPLPPDWIGRIDDHVHLHRSAAAMRAQAHGIGGERPREQEATTFPKAAIAVVIGIAVLLLVYALFFNP